MLAKSRNQTNTSNAFSYGLSYGGKTLIWAYAETFLVYFCTYALGLPPAMAGALVTCLLIVDVIILPVVSVFIQRSLTLGRPIFPWIRLAAPICGFFFTLMFWSWHNASQGCILAALTFTGIGFRASFTIIDLPLMASVGRLEIDGRRRNLVTLAGNLASTTARLALAVLTAIWLESRTHLNSERFLSVAATAALIGTTLYLVGFAQIDKHSQRRNTISEPSNSSERPRSPWRALLNRNILSLILLNVTFLLASSQIELSFIYLTRQDPNLHLRFSAVWTLSLIASAAGSYLWLRIANWIGKVGACSLSLVSVAIVALIYIITPSSDVSFLIIVVLLALSSNIAPIVFSILPDCIDEASEKFGYPVNIFITGIFITFGKLAIAGAHSIEGLLLQFSNFPIAPNLENYRLVVVGVTAGGSLLALIPLSRIRMSYKQHAQILERLAKQNDESS